MVDIWLHLALMVGYLAPSGSIWLHMAPYSARLQGSASLDHGTTRPRDQGLGPGPGWDSMIQRVPVRPQNDSTRRLGAREEPRATSHLSGRGLKPPLDHSPAGRTFTISVLAPWLPRAPWLSTAPWLPRAPLKPHRTAGRAKS